MFFEKTASLCILTKNLPLNSGKFFTFLLAISTDKLFFKVPLLVPSSVVHDMSSPKGFLTTTRLLPPYSDIVDISYQSEVLVALEILTDLSVALATSSKEDPSLNKLDGKSKCD